MRARCEEILLHLSANIPFADVTGRHARGGMAQEASPVGRARAAFGFDLSGLLRSVVGCVPLRTLQSHSSLASIDSAMAVHMKGSGCCLWVVHIGIDLTLEFNHRLENPRRIGYQCLDLDFSPKTARRGRKKIKNGATAIAPIPMPGVRPKCGPMFRPCAAGGRASGSPSRALGAPRFAVLEPTVRRAEAHWAYHPPHIQ